MSMKKDNPSGMTDIAATIFGMLSPVIIYMVMVTLLNMLGVGILDKIIEGGGDRAEYVSVHLQGFRTLVSACALILATAMQLPVMIAEKVKVAAVPFIKKSLPVYISSFITGVTVAITLNYILSVTGFTKTDGSYGDVAAKQFSLPLFAGIILYGLISPIAEEVVFRGLVFNRMKRGISRIEKIKGSRIAVILPIVLSALIFGLYHLNLIQAVYGTLMGILIAVIYDRHDEFIIPCLVHMGANLSIYLIFKIIELKTIIMTPVAAVATGVISIVLIYRLVSAKDPTKA